MIAKPSKSSSFLRPRTGSSSLRLALVGMLAAGACTSTLAGEDGDGSGGPSVDAGSNPNPGSDAFPQNGADSDEDGVSDNQDNCPRIANPGQEDGDVDEVGDACDCDPADNQNNAVLVVDDSLQVDSGLFSPTPGFNAQNWVYQEGGYRQTRLADEANDAALFQGLEMSDVYMSVTVASTEIADFDATDLRQLFLVARVTGGADNYDALGCGLEVVEGLSPTQKTTALSYSGGPPDQIDSEIFQRTDRAAIVIDEEAKLEMTLRGSTLTCEVTLSPSGKTIATANQVPSGSGYVGLQTRETKALFKDLRICEFRD